jgi:nucleoside-diphosphate-sugar epimerase
MAGLLVLGAGYLGAAVAARALDAGEAVTLADNWYATSREQMAPLEERGARVVTADLRRREDVDGLLAERPGRIHLFAAQASRPISDAEPDYTEATNVTGARLLAEAVAAAGGPSVAYASSLHVYGLDLSGEVGPDQPYGSPGDLAHITKVYAEQCLRMHARRSGFPLALFRLAVVYGPSPVEHDRPESQTVVDRFRRLREAGRPLTVDDGGRATLGVAHVDDVARIFQAWRPAGGVEAHNVVAETLTVGDVAALVEGRPATGAPAWRYSSGLTYRHRVANYLAP